MLDWYPNGYGAEGFAALLAERWDAASEEERGAGADWYPTARLMAEYLAEKHDTTAVIAAGVIAALSPQCPWQRNLEDADAILGGGDASDVFSSTSQVVKAWRIMDGEPWHEVLKGPKERPFAATIIDPTHGDPVLDTWAARTVMPRPLWFEARMVKRVTDRKQPRADLAEAYRIVARAVGVTVATVQATLWGQVRGSFV